MDEFRAELDWMRGKCSIRMHATANSITRLQYEDIYAGIAEFTRSHQSGCSRAYHQRCHLSTCFAQHALLRSCE